MRYPTFKDTTMYIDIHDSTFCNFLDATVNKSVILEGKGWGVIGYTDACTRIGDQRLVDVEAVNFDNVDWIDVSSITMAHGLGECLVSRNFYARCVYNHDPGREHVNVGNLLYLLSVPFLDRRLHAWSQDLRAYGVGWVRVQWDGLRRYVILEQEAGKSGKVSRVVRCIDKTFAPSDRACDMPYCLHERDDDNYQDIPFYKELTLGRCQYAGCTCGDTLSHWDESSEF